MLKDITEMVEIWYDPNPRKTVVPHDGEWVSEVYEFEDENDESIQRLSPWMVRIKLDSTMLTDKLSAMVRQSTQSPLLTLTLTR